MRKYTYNAIQIKLDMKQLTVKQRIEVLDSGLQDRCDSVRDACTRMLCEKVRSEVTQRHACLIDLLDVFTWVKEFWVLIGKLSLRPRTTRNVPSRRDLRSAAGSNADFRPPPPNS